MNKYKTFGILLFACIIVPSFVSASTASVASFTVTPATFNPHSYPNAYEVSYSLRNTTSSSGITIGVNCASGLTVQKMDDGGNLSPFTCGDIDVGGANGYFAYAEGDITLVFSNSSPEKMIATIVLSSYDMNSVSKTVSIPSTAGCSGGAFYNNLTGAPCRTTIVTQVGHSSCDDGAMFNNLTGALCKSTTQSPSNPVSSCTSGAMFNNLTGALCNSGNTNNPSNPIIMTSPVLLTPISSCASGAMFSNLTGALCKPIAAPISVPLLMTPSTPPSNVSSCDNGAVYNNLTGALCHPK